MIHEMDGRWRRGWHKEGRASVPNLFVDELAVDLAMNFIPPAT